MARKFIFETDWFSDCDDCVALRFLARNLDKEHLLLGVNVNAFSPYAYPSVCAFLENEKIDCPVGLDFDGNYQGEAKYQENMAKASTLTNTDAEDSLAFYKRILEENDGVEIISVGFLGALQRVFTTYPHLIKRVKKLWIMGGNWSQQGGKEYNFCGGNTQKSINASRFVVNELPCEQVFLGFEVGESVITGGRLPNDDMLYTAMRDWGAEHGRSSWDAMTVLLAFYDKFSDAFAYIYGKARIDNQGANYFEVCENGKQAIVKKTLSNDAYESAINGYLK